jgi:hypothetical protein
VLANTYKVTAKVAAQELGCKEWIKKKRRIRKKSFLRTRRTVEEGVVLQLNGTPLNLKLQSYISFSSLVSSYLFSISKFSLGFINNEVLRTEIRWKTGN